jgi:hypothetical protein
LTPSLLAVLNQIFMKLKIMAILMLVAVSCQKEKVSEQQPVKSASQSAISAGAKELLNDPDFVSFYTISQPVFNALKKGRTDLTELHNDNVLYYKECSTLAPKLGFKDSASLVDYFKQANLLAANIAKKHRSLNYQSYAEAVAMLNKTTLMQDPCDAVIGQYIEDVAECAALGLIPVIGEVLAGTCMVGALITYNAGMEQCSGPQ